ncbi:hypothetical protein DFR29_10481 [Tahibacter aquaticus]|uniref:DUF305 domain-containing protein n=1 Tax=Tahibacter aquaticus TaxID=520092 RepID=A0A4R6Z252_9GAMM|nr:DUF305 domain-containing protein [Tahibacter aquaticus]TDR45653.1 hypothetical protein DFR29_10481 [Tahibacter aquaticus]
MKTPHAAHAAPPSASSHAEHRMSGTKNHYPRFAAMVAASFVAMFALMYVMVDRFAHVLSNLNQVYMAALMAGAMVLIELAFMWKMYPDPKLNALLAAIAVVVVGVGWFGVRYQWGIGDSQFLRSMIPHHAGAILMCEEAAITSPEIRTLCGDIQRSQRAEIAQMQALLAAERQGQ